MQLPTLIIINYLCTLITSYNENINTKRTQPQPNRRERDKIIWYTVLRGLPGRIKEKISSLGH